MSSAIDKLNEKTFIASVKYNEKPHFAGIGPLKIQTTAKSKVLGTNHKLQTESP